MSCEKQKSTKEQIQDLLTAKGFTKSATSDRNGHEKWLKGVDYIHFLTTCGVTYFSRLTNAFVTYRNDTVIAQLDKVL